jgi:hypothetical protein
MLVDNVKDPGSVFKFGIFLTVLGLEILKLIIMVNHLCPF